MSEKLPKGWSAAHLASIALVTSGGTPARSQAIYWNGDIPWVTTGEVSFNIITTTNECITEIGLANSAAKIFPAETLLIALYGQGKTRGTVAKLGISAATNQACAAIIFNSQHNQSFYFYYFQNKYNELRELSNSGSQKNLSLDLLKSLLICSPPLAEQQKIAHILTTWDAAIVCTQRLLENSKQQKKALMQQLLIGNQHTVSSVTTWKSYKFSELFTTLCNANNPRADLSENGEYGYIHYGDIHKLTTDFLDCNQLSISKISKNKLTKIELLKEGDLLVADASEDYQGIGKSVEIKNLRGRHIVAGLHTILLRDNKKFLLDGFKGYIQHIPHVSKGLQKAATGISVFGISKRALLDVDVLLPPLDEQKAIAKILTAADALIAQYEVKLAHLQQQKKALMQQLLTGKIRVMPDTLGNAGATPA
jgi:Restriction endonuclease S subunits